VHDTSNFHLGGKPVDPQYIRDFQKFAEELERTKAWGEIVVVFRAGVPMSIASTVNHRINGPEQAAIARGEKPYVKEYRNTK
jgi:hypothetical protein